MRQVGARPWQILKDIPAPVYDPDLEVPIKVFGRMVEWFISGSQWMPNLIVSFTPTWDELYEPVRKISVGVALDMAAHTVVGQSSTQVGLAVWQELALIAEQMATAIISFPHDKAPWEKFFVSSSHLVEEKQKISDKFAWWHYFEEPMNRRGYNATHNLMIEAIDLLINQRAWEISLAYLMATLCMHPAGPLRLPNRSRRYTSTPLIDIPLPDINIITIEEPYPDLYETSYFCYEMPSIEMARETAKCMNHWINIWWQEVLKTVSFVFPKKGGKILL